MGYCLDQYEGSALGCAVDQEAGGGTSYAPSVPGGDGPGYRTDPIWRPGIQAGWRAKQRGSAPSNHTHRVPFDKGVTETLSNHTTQRFALAGCAGVDLLVYGDGGAG